MEGYVLIIAEKPESARHIAMALDRHGKPKEFKKGGITYFQSIRNKKLVVVPALGHLYTLIHWRRGRDYYPVFNFKWVPRHLAEKRAKKIQGWIDVISNLANDATGFIDACDYDIEGSLIGYCILKYACKNKENVARRMKYSTLTKRELEKAYEELFPHLDLGMIEAGKTRHEVDWLYGVNLSRALTLAAKRWSKKYATISTGRVQGPTLRFLVEREKRIQCFVPTPYWKIRAEVEIKSSVYEVEYEITKFESRAKTDNIINDCEGKTGKVKEVAVTKYRQSPPVPFDIGSLQREAYRLFGYTPRRTLNIAERLYLQALISYPRTSSQKLPHVIAYKNILSALSREPAYKELADALLRGGKLEPKEGKKVDPAHPAVYPTGVLPDRRLSGPAKKIWDLVVRRFLAVFSDPAIKQSLRVDIGVRNHLFYLRGKRILKRGWMLFYQPYITIEEVILPPIERGEAVHFKRVIREDKFVNPPPRYNPSSLLKKMEEVGIGTKATRASVIQTLSDRGYITERRIRVTSLGFDVVDVLSKYCPRVLSLKLTRSLEEKMERIQIGKEKREKVLEESVDQLRPILHKFKSNENVIGRALSNAVKLVRMQERIIGGCPNCGEGELLILRSRKTGKRFIGCTSYFKGACVTSFPLPQRGTLKPTKTNCQVCGWPLIWVQAKGRRPWMLCFNPLCSRKEGKH